MLDRLKEDGGVVGGFRGVGGKRDVVVVVGREDEAIWRGLLPSQQKIQMLGAISKRS